MNDETEKHQPDAETTAPGTEEVSRPSEPEGPLAGERLRALPGGVHFAFAWLAFNPDSQIYRPGATRGN